MPATPYPPTPVPAETTATSLTWLIPALPTGADYLVLQINQTRVGWIAVSGVSFLYGGEKVKVDHLNPDTLYYFRMGAVYSLSDTTTYSAMVSAKTSPSSSPDNPPPVLTFSVSDTQVTAGQEVTLTWSATHADSVTIQGIGTYNANDSINVTVNATTTLTAVATGPGGIDTKSVTITVTTPSRPVLTFSVSPTQIIAGQEVTVTWSAPNATSVVIQGVGTYGPTGSIKVQLSTTTTLTATATGPGGTDTKSIVVTVIQPDLTRPSLALSVDPSSIAAGASATLTWSASNATKVTIGGIDYQPAGSMAVHPAQTTTYTATATGAGGTDIKSVTLTVQVANQNNNQNGNNNQIIPTTCGYSIDQMKGCFTNLVSGSGFTDLIHGKTSKCCYVTVGVAGAVVLLVLYELLSD